MFARAHGRYPPTKVAPARSVHTETAYGEAARRIERTGMKVVNSLKSAKKRHKECRVIRRKGRVYVVNKRNPRFKARQG